MRDCLFLSSEHHRFSSGFLCMHSLGLQEEDGKSSEDVKRMQTQAVVSSTLTFLLLQDHLLTYQHLLEQVQSLASQSLEMPGGFPARPQARSRTNYDTRDIWLRLPYLV
jgi:hypothetical protein